MGPKVESKIHLSDHRPAVTVPPGHPDERAAGDAAKLPQPADPTPQAIGLQWANSAAAVHEEIGKFPHRLRFGCSHD
jgi:hypothetical protein